MTEQKIYYKKVRDLGGIFGATFGFIKQNFKPLYGSLLYFAGPFLMVAATISAYMMGASFSVNNIIARGDVSRLFGEMLLPYVTSMLVMFIGVTVYNVILNRNVIENEKLMTGEPLTVRHGIVNFWSDFWRILGNTLLLVIFLFIALLVMVLVFAGIFALAGGERSGGGIIVAVLGVIAIFVCMLIFGPIIAYVPMAAIFLCQRDELNIFQALGKVFHYMRGNFWSTWVVSMVGLLAYMVLGMLAQIPVAIVSFITAFSRVKSTVGYGIQDESTPVLLLVVTAIGSLLSYAVMVVYHLMAIYIYTSLEEKKEGSGIMDKINQVQ